MRSCPWCLSWLQELEKERDNLQNEKVAMMQASGQRDGVKRCVAVAANGQKSCRGQGCAELGERCKSAVRAVLPQKLQQLHAASEEERKRLETYYKDRITQYDEKLREVSGGCAGFWEKGTAHVKGLHSRG